MHTTKKSIAVILVYNLIWTQAFASSQTSAGAPPKLPPVYPPVTYSDGSGAGGSGGGSGNPPPSTPSNGPADSGGEDSIDKKARQNLSSSNTSFRALEAQEKILLRDLDAIERELQTKKSRLSEGTRRFLETRHAEHSRDLARVHREMLQLVQMEIRRIRVAPFQEENSKQAERRARAYRAGIEAQHRALETQGQEIPRNRSLVVIEGNPQTSEAPSPRATSQPTSPQVTSPAGWFENAIKAVTERLGIMNSGQLPGVTPETPEPSRYVTDRFSQEETQRLDALQERRQLEQERQARRAEIVAHEQEKLRGGKIVGSGSNLTLVDPKSSLSYEAQRQLQQLRSASVLGDLAQRRAVETRGQEIPRNRALILVDGSPVQKPAPSVRVSNGKPEVIERTVPGRSQYAPNPLDTGRAQSTGGYFNWKGEHVPWEIERPSANSRPQLTPQSFRASSATYFGDAKEFSKDIPMNMAIIMGVIGLMSCSKAEFSYAHNPEACISFFSQTKDPWFYAQFISMMMVAHGLSYKMGLAHGPSMSAQVARSIFQGSGATPAGSGSAANPLKLPFLSAFAWTAATAVTMVGIEFLRDPDVQMLIKNTHSQPSMACKIREARGGAACSFEESQASRIKHGAEIDKAWQRVFEKFSDMEQLRNVDIVVGTVFATTLAVVGGMNAFKAISTRVGQTYRLPSLSVRIPMFSSPTLHVVARTTVVIAAFFAVASVIAPVLAEAVTSVRGSGHLLVGLSNMTRDLSKGLGLPPEEVRGLILSHTSVTNGGVNVTREALQSELKRIEKYFSDREAQDYDSVMIDELVQPPLMPVQVVERQLKREINPEVLMSLSDRTVELRKAMSKRYGYIAADFLGKYNAWGQHVNTFVNETESAERFLRDFYRAAMVQRRRGLNPGQFLGRGLDLGERTIQAPSQQGPQRNILIARAISRGVADWTSVIWLSNQNLERLIKWNEQGLSASAVGMIGRYIQTFESGVLIGSSDSRPVPQSAPQTDMPRYLDKVEADLRAIVQLQGSQDVSADEVRASALSELETEITNHVLKTAAVPGVADAPRAFINMLQQLSQSGSNLSVLGGGNAREGLQRLLKAEQDMQKTVDHFNTQTFLDGTFQTVPNPDNFWTAETWGRNGLVTKHEDTAISFRSRVEHLAIYLLCGANPFTESQSSFLRRVSVATRPGLAAPRMAKDSSRACGLNIPILSSLLGRQTTQGNLLTGVVPGLDGGSDGWLFEVLSQKLPKDLTDLRQFESWFNQEPGLRLADAYSYGASELNRSFAKMARESLGPIWDLKETQSARTWYAGETTERSGRWWWERAWEPLMSWWTGKSNPAPEEDRIADPELLDLNFHKGLRLAILNDAAIGLKLTAVAAYGMGLLVPNTQSSQDFIDLLVARYDILAIRPSAMTEEQAKRFEPFFPVVVQDPPQVELNGMRVTATEIAEANGDPGLAETLFNEMLEEYRRQNSKPWITSKDAPRIHQQIRERLDTVLATYWPTPLSGEEGEAYKTLTYNSLRAMTGVLDGASNGYALFQRNLESGEILGRR